ncbi:retinol dehydrogenase 12 [Nemania serpens]|nr:retinol dehydrogenase 12 [Nemania serpens]
MSSQLQSKAAFEASFIAFLHRQWLVHRKPVPAGTNLSSQAAIITGSNSGLGLEAGRQLLQLGLAHLVIAVRSQSKGDAAAEGLRREFPRAQISVFLLDMSSYDSIAAFAERCKSLPRIDIVLLNAGLMGSKTFATSKDTGHEHASQINYISTALLTILLLPILKAKRIPEAKPPVLTIVTSDSAFWASLETRGVVLPQLDKPQGYAPMTWYQKTKLLQHFFVAKLAQEVDSRDVILNMVNPGMCAGTAFGDDKSGFSALLVGLFNVFKWLMARPVAVGASTYVDAVVRGEESHGSYVSDWAIRPYPGILYTQEGGQLGERLWDETMKELDFADASDIIQRMKK